MDSLLATTVSGVRRLWDLEVREQFAHNKHLPSWEDI